MTSLQRKRARALRRVIVKLEDAIAICRFRGHGAKAVKIKARLGVVRGLASSD